jgi:hypothetical protein
MKGFASETLLAVMALCLFFEIVLAPKGIMLEHGKCLRFIRYALDILFYGSDEYALNHSGFLRSLLREHHDLFIVLYTISLAKPKLHFCYHLPDNFEKFLVRLNCFKPERDHTFGKSWSQHQRKLLAGDYMLKRWLLSLFGNLDETRFCKEELLGKTTDNPRVLKSLQQLDPNVSSVITSNRLRCETTTLGRGKIISLRLDSAVNPVLGQAVSFASASRLLSQEPSYFIVYHAMRQASPGVWVQSAPSTFVCHVDKFWAQMPHVCVSGGIRLLLPLQHVAPN